MTLRIADTVTSPKADTVMTLGIRLNNADTSQIALLQIDDTITSEIINGVTSKIANAENVVTSQIADEVTKSQIEDNNPVGNNIFVSAKLVEVTPPVWNNKIIKHEIDVYLGYYVDVTDMIKEEVPICNNQFTQKGSLVEHQRIYDGKKPYQWDICNKQFIQKYNLALYKRMHNGEKAHHCDICNKQFSVKGNFVRHKRIHNEEKIYHGEK